MRERERVLVCKRSGTVMFQENLQHGFDGGLVARAIWHYLVVLAFVNGSFQFLSDWCQMAMYKAFLGQFLELGCEFRQEDKSAPCSIRQRGRRNTSVVAVFA